MSSKGVSDSFQPSQLFSLHKNVGLHPYQEMMKTCGRLTDCSTDFRAFSCLSEFGKTNTLLIYFIAYLYSTYLYTDSTMSLVHFMKGKFGFEALSQYL